MKSPMRNILHFVREEEAAAAIEYGLLAAFIAVVIAATVATVGTNLNTLYEDVVAIF